MFRLVFSGIMVMSLMLIAGCVKKNSEKKEVTVPIEQPVNASYIGHHLGCVKHYDPLYCPEKYAKGVLNSGDIVTIKDANGSDVVLDRIHKSLEEGNKGAKVWN